jgi:hypothetical protein
MTPRAAALYKQLWGGPVDLLTLSAAGRDLAPDDLHAALRPRDEWLGGPVHSARPDTESPTWLTNGFREEDIRRSLGRQFDLDWAKLNSKVVLIDPNANPYVPIRRSGWKTDESLKLPLAGSLFVVGQLQANSGSIEYQQYEFIGRTGVGMRLPEWLGGEIQVRSGRSKANYDTDTESMFPGKVTTFFELATKWPVLGRLNLEYTGKAIPAPTSADHDVWKQELKLALPFSDSGQFHVGARYRWEDAATQSPWHERMNVFIGLQMKR